MKRTVEDFEESSFVPEETGNERSAGGLEDEDLDLLPEFCHYRDEGCELAPACLECPFPDCIYEQYRGNLAPDKYLRDREIIRLHEEEKIKGEELSIRFRVSLRTVRRILASGRKKNE
ncbi:MAG: hypothetical protein JXA46_08210 [Dehalococcoidales bacterium]|nr:hypothetical protein [Dehalococcoidales bacterium]